MSIQEQMVAMLLAGTALPPERICALVAPALTVRPYIVYQRIIKNSENVLSGSSGLVNSRMQLDVYADSYGAAQALADQVDALMSAWAVQNVSISAQDMYEQDVKLHRVQADYSIWHS